MVNSVKVLIFVLCSSYWQTETEIRLYCVFKSLLFFHWRWFNSF